MALPTMAILSFPSVHDFGIAHGAHPVAAVERRLTECTDVVFCYTVIACTNCICESHRLSPVSPFSFQGYYYALVNESHRGWLIRVANRFASVSFRCCLRIGEFCDRLKVYC